MLWFFTLVFPFIRKYLFISLNMFSMNLAKILCRNCRGISDQDTFSWLFKLIKKLKPLLVCLVETNANSDWVDLFCKKTLRHWEWASVFAKGFSGGIFILWSLTIGQVTPIVASPRALHIVVSTTFSKTFLISVVYNSSRCFNQRFLWHELSKLSSLSGSLAHSWGL